MKKVFRFIAAAALVCLFAACKKDPIEVQSVSLDKTTLTMAEGSSEQLTATVKPDNATNRNVSWSSSDTSVATVSSDGKVTAVKAGTATIIVTTEDGGKTATCKVTVDAKAVSVTGVTLDKTEIELTEGDKEQLTATVAPDNATNRNVSWSSSDTSVATVSSDGKVTAVKAGTATIIVTTEDGGKTATCKVTIISDIPVPAEGVQLWADGPYWATTNIGAANAWDYGLYFEWGNIIGYAPSGDSFSHSFDETNYAKTPGSKLAGDFKTASYDAAQTSWGGKWRMPTKAEFDALLSNCDKKWYDGVEDQYCGKPVAGYKFTGKGDYSGNSIFLPAAGYGGGSTLGNAGSHGFYWSSSYRSSSYAYHLVFFSVNASTGGSYRYKGFPVRPVSD